MHRVFGPMSHVGRVSYPCTFTQHLYDRSDTSHQDSTLDDQWLTYRVLVDLDVLRFQNIPQPSRDLGQVDVLDL